MLDDLLQFVPPHHQNDYLRLMQRVPFYVRNFCMVGRSGPALGYLLKKRIGLRASGLVADAQSLPLAEKMLDAAYLLQDGDGRVPLDGFDAVFVSNLETALDDQMARLAAIVPRLSSQCHLFMLFAAPPELEGGAERIHALILEQLTTLGYQEQHRWSVEGGGKAVGYLCMAVSADYDPIAHAQILVDEGFPERAYELIETVSREESVPFERRAQLHWERLCILTAWLEADPGLEPTVRLMAAQESFYFVVFALPQESLAYQAMARCWHAMGHDDMARRLLRSIQHVAPQRVAEELLKHLGTGGGAIHAGNPDASEWHDGPPLRVLFLMNPRPHYGIDVLFDGLCAVLGDEQVVDYPYKPWLHGEDTAQLAHYPCRFQRQGRSLPIEEILSELVAGRFDLILYADIEGDLDRAEMVAIMQHAGTCPVAVVDGLDEFSDFRGRVSEYLNFDRFAAYFKREKLRGVDYGPKAFPLPFSYDGHKALPVWGGERPHPCFWAGHRMFGKRRLYLEAVESHFGWDLNATYAPEDYIARIRNSRVGLNCFGMGFDTVRFWELPAHGCMLLSERLPIEMPFAFAADKHAVFFDDLPCLLEQTAYFEAHPQEAAAIAEAGHAHFLAHHTNEARARQLLGGLRSQLIPSPV